MWLKWPFGKILRLKLPLEGRAMCPCVSDLQLKLKGQFATHQLHLFLKIYFITATQVATGVKITIGKLQNSQKHLIGTLHSATSIRILKKLFENFCQPSAIFPINLYSWKKKIFSFLFDVTEYSMQIRQYRQERNNRLLKPWKQHKYARGGIIMLLKITCWVALELTKKQSIVPHKLCWMLPSTATACQKHPHS